MREGLPIYRAVSGPLTPAGRFRSTLGDAFLTESLGRFLRETRPHVLHVQHLMGLPALALAREASVTPVLVTLHDYWWRCANAQLLTDYRRSVCDGPQLWLNCARCGLARSGAGKAWPAVPLVACLFAWRAFVVDRMQARVAAWIAPTRFVRDWYVSRGLPAGHVHVVGHGIEPPPADLVRRTRPQRKAQVLHVAYIGGLAPQKGVHVLVDAFGGLPESCQLAVAGDEAAFPDYCADLHRLARHPGIRFLGRLNRTQAWQALADADVLVVPSIWFETSSLVIQEAFAVGTPVIASDLGALSERVRQEEDGLLFTAGDAGALRQVLQRLLDSPDLLARLRQGILPPVYLPDHSAQLEKIYSSLVRGEQLQRNPRTVQS
jgi:glycosyltransferase involved in cell wall biosynthesis